jgi:hypothetical protein
MKNILCTNVLVVVVVVITMFVPTVMGWKIAALFVCLKRQNIL